MLIERNGWFWPETDREAHTILPMECEHFVPWVLGHVTGRDCIVQAGGNVGLFADALADHFKIVETVEPDADNWQALVRNITAKGVRGIRMERAAFGDRMGRCRIHAHEPDNSGAHMIQEGGDILLLPIDGLALTACDAIWLDVEGSELPALKGARETIRRFHPVIICEEKGLGKHFGYHEAEIEDYLSQAGYEPVERHYSDRLYKYAL